MLKPRAVVITNLFRDQLDRYAEVSAAAAYLREGIAAVPEAVLCLNADDSLLFGLADGLTNRKVYYGFSEGASRKSGPKIGEEGTRCPRCGAGLKFSCSSYGHLGHWSCPECGLSRPSADISVESFYEGEDGSDCVFDIFGKRRLARVSAPADYNVYNAAAALSGAIAAGYGEEAALGALSSFWQGFGRMERFGLGGGAVMILIKNPACFDRAAEYILKRQGDFDLFICLNDFDADGCDVSWIWDAEFEQLCEAGERLKSVTASGSRSRELVTRLEYAGIPREKIAVESSARKLVKAISRSQRPTYILPTYTAMLELRRILAEKTRRGGFWEG